MHILQNDTFTASPTAVEVTVSVLAKSIDSARLQGEALVSIIEKASPVPSLVSDASLGRQIDHFA